MASTDRDALVALYNATDGADRNNETNWNTDADIWQWHGIEVNSQGRVLDLRLECNNLRGAIPPELGRLPALKVLFLEVNKLSGESLGLFRSNFTVNPANGVYVFCINFVHYASCKAMLF
ncbi:unnamed protein product [Pylaiella littoralis]